jgi:hypothetical protein
MTKKDDRPEIKEEADAEKVFQAGKPDHDLPGHDRPNHPEHPEHDLPHRPGHPDHDLPATPEPKPKAPEPPKRGPGPGGRAVVTPHDADALPPPTVSGLLPSSAAIGDPSFVVRVIGTGFTDTSVINFADQDEPTTFVSDVELTTGVNMDMWLGADPALKVLVKNTDGQTSNSVDFAMTPPRDVPLPEAHASIPVPTMDLITRM